MLNLQPFTRFTFKGALDGVIYTAEVIEKTLDSTYEVLLLVVMWQDSNGDLESVIYEDFDFIQNSLESGFWEVIKIIEQG